MGNKVFDKKSIIVLTIVTLIIVATVSVNLINSEVQGVMIVVQAHSDDFDLSLSGQAITYKLNDWVVIIVEVTDLAEGHYNYAVNENFIEPDVAINSTFEAPDGTSYLRPFYSNNLRDLRFNNMKERYDRRGFILIQPDTLVPDVIWQLPDYVQKTYYNAAKMEILRKLNDKLKEYRGLSIPFIFPGRRLHILFYVHDPTVNEHGDHVFAGRLGIDVYEDLDVDMGDSKLRYYYVYTEDKTLEGYTAVNISDVYNFKLQLFEEVWEFEVTGLRSLMTKWHKDPWFGDDYWFKYELMKDVK